MADDRIAKIKPGSQGARILNALRDARWTSVAEVHRRAGTSRLNSRVSELRKRGFTIEHRVVKGKARASLAHQYRLIDPPRVLPSPETPDGKGKIERDTLDRDAIPRDKPHRFRLYILDEKNKLELMATASTEEQVGVEICRLGRSGQIAKACVGLLDSYGLGNEIFPGFWIVNPFDAKLV